MFVVCILLLQTGQVSEDDFANQIEKDLQSQHQPSLLPFLKVRVLLFFPLVLKLVQCVICKHKDHTSESFNESIGLCVYARTYI